jgi:Asp-tRNA(Asn)/Glu-tRNA(Gln) amidotransferase A subunit family amidase
MSLTLVDYISQVRSGLLDPRVTVSSYLQKAKDQHAAYNAFVRFHDDHALKQAIDTNSLLA